MRGSPQHSPIGTPNVNGEPNHSNDTRASSTTSSNQSRSSNLQGTPANNVAMACGGGRNTTLGSIDSALGQLPDDTTLGPRTDNYDARSTNKKAYVKRLKLAVSQIYNPSNKVTKQTVRDARILRANALLDGVDVYTYSNMLIAAFDAKSPEFPELRKAAPSSDGLSSGPPPTRGGDTPSAPNTGAADNGSVSSSNGGEPPAVPSTVGEGVDEPETVKVYLFRKDLMCILEVYTAIFALLWAIYQAYKQLDIAPVVALYASWTDALAQVRTERFWMAITLGYTSMYSVEIPFDDHARVMEKVSGLHYASDKTVYNVEHLMSTLTPPVFDKGLTIYITQSILFGRIFNNSHGFSDSNIPVKSLNRRALGYWTLVSSAFQLFWLFVMLIIPLIGGLLLPLLAMQSILFVAYLLSIFANGCTRFLLTITARFSLVSLTLVSYMTRQAPTVPWGLRGSSTTSMTSPTWSLASTPPSVHPNWQTTGTGYSTSFATYLAGVTTSLSGMMPTNPTLSEVLDGLHIFTSQQLDNSWASVIGATTPLRSTLSSLSGQSTVKFQEWYSTLAPLPVYLEDGYSAFSKSEWLNATTYAATVGLDSLSQRITRLSKSFLTSLRQTTSSELTLTTDSFPSDVQTDDSMQIVTSMHATPRKAKKSSTTAYAACQKSISEYTSKLLASAVSRSKSALSNAVDMSPDLSDLTKVLEQPLQRFSTRLATAQSELRSLVDSTATSPVPKTLSDLSASLTRQAGELSASTARYFNTLSFSSIHPSLAKTDHGSQLSTSVSYSDQLATATATYLVAETSVNARKNVLTKSLQAWYTLGTTAYTMPSSVTSATLEQLQEQFLTAWRSALHRLEYASQTTNLELGMIYKRAMYRIFALSSEVCVSVTSSTTTFLAKFSKEITVLINRKIEDYDRRCGTAWPARELLPLISQDCAKVRVDLDNELREIKRITSNFVGFYNGLLAVCSNVQLRDDISMIAFLEQTRRLQRHYAGE